MRVLLAAVPQPPKWTSLPYAADEIDCLTRIIPPHSMAGGPKVLTEALRTGASADDVLDHLPSATVLHLACHGYQDPKNALDSGFVMSDRILTVANLMALQLPDALLAFLSACETAKGDDAQPDQAVHLAAAMLFVGFKSVVGTMWWVLLLLGLTICMFERTDITQVNGRCRWSRLGEKGV